MTEEGVRGDSLIQAVYEYNSQPHTPELLTSIFSTIWQIRAKSIGHNINVSDCPYTKEELEKINKQGKRVGYLAPWLTGKPVEGFLEQIFPQMRIDGLESGNLVKDLGTIYGWFDYEASINAPHLRKTEEQLHDLFQSQKRFGMNLSQYIVAGQDSKLFTGKYLDEDKTFTSLLRSSRGGHIVNAHFEYDGRLRVFWPLSPSRFGAVGGGRSTGVK